MGTVPQSHCIFCWIPKQERSALLHEDYCQSDNFDSVHMAMTVVRCRFEKCVLAVPDTNMLNFNAPRVVVFQISTDEVIPDFFVRSGKKIPL